MRAPSATGLLSLLPALLFGAGAGALAAQDSVQQAGHEHGMDAEHSDHEVEGGGVIPVGWTARADKNAGTGNVKVVPMGKGIHVTLGPAIILYRDKTGGNGP